jgi:D-sedoheptulose 7-phosphate isomerase
MKELENYIQSELKSSLETKKDFVEKNLSSILKAATIIAEATKNGGKILYCGNGGSAADAQHLAAEHINKLRVERAALGAIALTTDSSIITSVANDISFDEIFSRQIQGLAQSNDVVIGISTSGNSENIIRALKVASSKKIKTIAFTGGNGGKIKEQNLADIILNVEGSKISSRVQETHIFLGHILIELMDKILMTK